MFFLYLFYTLYIQNKNFFYKIKKFKVTLKKLLKNLKCKINKNLTLKKLLKNLKCKINKNLTLKKSLK